MEQQQIMDLYTLGAQARMRRLRVTCASLSTDRQVELLAIAETLAKLPCEWCRLRPKGKHDAPAE